MQTTRKWIEELGYEVIYGDTDSIFVNVNERLNATDCNEIGNDVMQIINKRWSDSIKTRFSLTSYLEIEFDEN